MDSLDIRVWVAAHFELKFRVAFGATERHFALHFLRTLLRNGAVQGERFTVPSAKERDDGLSSDLAKDVPAGNVERGLDIRMAAQGRVHAVVQHQQCCRIETDEMTREFRDPRTCAFGIGW